MNATTMRMLTAVITGITAASLYLAAPAHAIPQGNVDACPSENNSGPFLLSAAVSDATSCPFAEDVRFHYNMLSDQLRASGQVEIEAHSPTTGQSYLMTCVPGSEVRGDGVRVNAIRCTGGIGDSAVVDLW